MAFTRQRARSSVLAVRNITTSDDVELSEETARLARSPELIDPPSMPPAAIYPPSPGPLEPFPAVEPLADGPWSSPAPLDAPSDPSRTAPSLPLLTRLRNRSRAQARHRSAAARAFYYPSSIPSQPSSSTHAASPSTDSPLPGPTFTKTYPSRPKLPVAVFIPPPHASAPGPLPLYIHVAPTTFLPAPHPPRRRPKKQQSAQAQPEPEGSADKQSRGKGAANRGSGGKAKAQKPWLSASDIFCARLAHSHGICVASVTFRSPPRWMHPTQAFDVAAVAADIVGGKGLPIDRRRVAIGGVGAGATVALATCQAEELRAGVVSGVVAVGGVLDFARGWGDRLGKGAGDGAGAGSAVEPGAEKTRRGAYELMAWACVPPGQDLTEPMLSPAYAPRSALPPNVFLAAAEGDVLCAEAEGLAARLASEGGAGVRAGVGVGAGAGAGRGARNRAEGEAERGGGRGAAAGSHRWSEATNEGDGLCWERAGVRWEKVQGWQTGFFEAPEKVGTDEEQRKALDGLIDSVGAWLWKTVYE